MNHLRTTLKIRRPDIAKAVGVTSNYIGMVEAGKRTVSMDLLDRLAKAYGVKMWFIMKLAEEGME